MKRILISLISTLSITAYANLFERDDFVFQDRISQQPLEAYIESDKELNNIESNIYDLLKDPKYKPESLELFCRFLDIKYERLALAAANIKYSQAYAVFQTKQREIESESQANKTFPLTCYQIKDKARTGSLDKFLN